MKHFKFLYAGYALSWKEIMEKLNLNDETAVEIIVDKEKQTVTIYTQVGSIGLPMVKIQNVEE